MKWVPEDDLEKKALQNYEVTFIGIQVYDSINSIFNLWRIQSSLNKPSTKY